jgi:hypothetical protein
MKSERYQILALTSIGHISTEESDRLLAALGRKQRLLSRAVWFTGVAVVSVCAVFWFHLGEPIRLMFLSSLQTLDGFEAFRKIHELASHVLESL